MNRLEKQHWLRLWQDAEAKPLAEALSWHQRLIRAYAEAHRRYHTSQHLAECLSEFDAARHLATQPVAVEMALWFHDAVYDVHAGDNEERSALLAEECLSQAGQPHLGQRVGALVLATKTHRADGDQDAALVVDVDLSILGQPERRYAEYETQIRDEYGWVPAAIFNAERRKILQRFLERERLYTTDHFASKYESAARHNLEQAVRRLTGPC